MARIFISYSHDDEAWKDRVVSQLGVLEHEGLLSVCSRQLYHRRHCQSINLHQRVVLQRGGNGG